MQSHIPNKNFFFATVTLLTVTFCFGNSALSCFIQLEIFDILQQQETLYCRYTNLGSQVQFQRIKINHLCRPGCTCKLTLVHQFLLGMDCLLIFPTSLIMSGTRAPLLDCKCVVSSKHSFHGLVELSWRLITITVDIFLSDPHSINVCVPQSYVITPELFIHVIDLPFLHLHIFTLLLMTHPSTHLLIYFAKLPCTKISLLWMIYQILNSGIKTALHSSIKERPLRFSFLVIIALAFHTCSWIAMNWKNQLWQYLNWYVVITKLFEDHINIY